eukprot:ctg_1831.g625
MNTAWSTTFDSSQDQKRVPHPQQRYVGASVLDGTPRAPEYVQSAGGVGDDAALVHYPHVIPGPLPAEAVPVPQGALGHQVGGDYGERAVPHLVGHCELPGRVEVGRHEVATVSGVLAGGAGADVRS